MKITVEIDVPENFNVSLEEAIRELSLWRFQEIHPAASPWHPASEKPEKAGIACIIELMGKGCIYAVGVLRKDPLTQVISFHGYVVGRFMNLDFDNKSYHQIKRYAYINSPEEK